MNKILICCVIVSVFFSCSKEGVKEREPRVNCGKIVRIWTSQESSEDGNPCADNRDYSRDIAFIVKNDITGNTRAFCVNLSVLVRYDVGSVYCDQYNLSGW